MAAASPLSAVDLAPLLPLAGVALAVALVPLAIWWWRHRHAPIGRRLAALTALTLFLTFDLIVFGAFTRLTDSGLGCPDWPGCYGHASPLGAHSDIRAAEQALPSGPVTQAKAWIEMLHRYLAMGVGLLIIAGLALAWRHRRVLPHGIGWPVLTLAWVLVQGMFGKYTVTLKLYPAVVTLHLLGALILLMLLVRQHESFRARPLAAPGVARGAALAVLGVLLLQAALGAWVSSNYAVLACRGFPQCNGQWWPEGDLAMGFTLLRPLGGDGQGAQLPFEALVSIHWVHRLFALVATVAIAALARALWRSAEPAARRVALWLLVLLLAQVLSGLSNVVLDWPIAAALAHSAGAAALVGVLTSLAVRLQPQAARAARLPTADAATPPSRPAFR